MSDECPPVPLPDHSKKVFNTRPLVHQESSISPGTVDMPPPAGTPWPAVISHTSHQPPIAQQPPHMLLPGQEQSHRRGSAHLPSQMGPDAVLMQEPLPAHCISLINVLARSIRGTPPQNGVSTNIDINTLLSQCCPVLWEGILALKNNRAAVRMHFLSGNPIVAKASLPPVMEGEMTLRVTQRMKLESVQLDGVKKKIMLDDKHCVLFALPCGKDQIDVLHQSSNLKNGFINYLRLKQAAGIVNVAPPGCQQASYVIHMFPSCEFTYSIISRIAADLLPIICDISHLVIIITSV